MQATVTSSRNMIKKEDPYKQEKKSLRLPFRQLERRGRPNSRVRKKTSPWPKSKIGPMLTLALMAKTLRSRQREKEGVDRVPTRPEARIKKREGSKRIVRVPKNRG